MNADIIKLLQAVEVYLEIEFEEAQGSRFVRAAGLLDRVREQLKEAP